MPMMMMLNREEGKGLSILIFPLRGIKPSSEEHIYDRSKITFVDFHESCSHSKLFVIICAYFRLFVIICDYL